MNQQQKLTQIKGEPRPASDRARTGAGEAAAAQVEVSETAPPESPLITWALLSEFALIATGFVATVAALYFARSIVMPVLAALIIGITLHPIQKRADEYRVPPVLTALCLVLLFFTILYFTAALMVGTLTTWVADTPELGATVKEKFRWLERPLATFRQFAQSMSGSGAPASPGVSIEASLLAFLRGAVAVLTPAITEFLVFFGTLLFFLVGSNRLRRQLITFFGSRDARLRVVRIWNDIEQNLITYVGTVTLINVALGAATTLTLYLLDFPAPVFFGVLTFALNYIPYIGPAIIVATLFAVGLIATPTIGSAALPPLLFVAIFTVEGHFITPSIIGRRLTLSPFLVFLALAFWTWLWGPLGAFLATPLLIVGLVLLSHLFPKEDDVALPQ